MHTLLPDIPDNKENALVDNKPRTLNPIPRAFGTDLTKIPSDSRSFTYQSPYSEEILTNLFECEDLYSPNSDYMRDQIDINEKMRAILVDWLVEIHLKFRLAEETLHLTVDILDRYLDKTPISRNKLQLVGVAAMLIASKYEDIYSPELREFVYITDFAYTKDEILAMEISILKQLQYNITVPSAFSFLQHLADIAKCSKTQFCLCQYIIELALTDYRMLRFSKSLVAASALYMINKIKGIVPEWSTALAAGSPYTEEELNNCAQEMCVMYQQAQKSSLQGVKSKFAKAKFLQVSNAPLF
jgi:G2/mitotic-specific cyclin-B, other